MKKYILNKALVFSFLTTIVLQMSFCQSQEFPKEIIGKWQAFKKTTLDGEDGSNNTLDGSPYVITLNLIFFDDGKAIFTNEAGEVHTSYSFKDGELQIANFKYTIVQISNGQMVLKEKKLLGGLVYLKKV